MDPATISELFEILRVPAPVNVKRDLQLLEQAHLTVKRKASEHWAPTPNGIEQVMDLMGAVDLDHLAPDLTALRGADFGDELHTTIAPEFSPIQWARPISEFLARHPFEKNVFLITRFPQDESDTEYLDPVRHLVPALEDELANHGLSLLLASDRQIVDDLLGNVAAHIWVSRYGIGLLEDRLGRGLNYNVMTEIGAMLVTGRRCALLKDTSAPKSLPSDIGGQIYKSVDFDDAAEVVAAVRRWVTDDLMV